MAAGILRSRQDLVENLDEILRSRRDLGQDFAGATAPKTAENMAALNVDCITWIITVLGAINSNHTFIFELHFFLGKLKTSKGQVVSFLPETKHKVF